MKKYPGDFSSWKQLIGHVVTFGYADTDETTTGILYKEYPYQYKVLDHNGKVQRIDSPRQVLRDWGKATYKNIK